MIDYQNLSYLVQLNKPWRFHVSMSFINCRYLLVDCEQDRALQETTRQSKRLNRTATSNTHKNEKRYRLLLRARIIRLKHNHYILLSKAIIIHCHPSSKSPSSSSRETSHGKSNRWNLFLYSTWWLCFVQYLHF